MAGRILTSSPPKWHLYFIFTRFKGELNRVCGRCSIFFDKHVSEECRAGFVSYRIEVEKYPLRNFLFLFPVDGLITIDVLLAVPAYVKLFNLH
jgi:hypothetical protein